MDSIVQNQNRLPSFDSFTLKIIAIVTMVIDHIGAILYPEVIVLRMIGRLSFPIFCFLLVEGFYHTKNIKKYEIRMMLFAFLSELPFDLAFSDSWFYLKYQNIFFTLFFGLILMQLLSLTSNQIMRFLAIVLFMFMAELFSCDYGAQGILVIMIFYLFRDHFPIKAGTFSIIEVACNLNSNVQMLSIFSLIPIGLYNGKKGKSLKYFFYIFYPAHLIVLYIIKKYWY